MKIVQVNIDYSYEVNSSNEEWLNHDDRHCDILVRDDEAETIKYSGCLDQHQLEHVIVLIKKGSSVEDIQDLIKHYETENLKVDHLVGDPKFMQN